MAELAAKAEAKAVAAQDPVPIPEVLVRVGRWDGPDETMEDGWHL